MNRLEHWKVKTVRRLLMGACFAGILAGCAGLEVHRVKTGQDQKEVESGLRFPVPRPYVLVKAPSGNTEALDFEILYLPDPEEEILVKATGRFGPTRFKIGVDEGGFLRELSGRLRSIKVKDDNQRPSPAEIASLARGLEPGLYRIVWPAGGGTPHLKRVDPHPLPGPRITGILFETCADERLPELVRQIVLVLDREAGANHGQLTGNVIVMKNGSVLKEEVSWKNSEGGRLVFTVNEDCSGEYKTWQVVLPDGRSGTFPSAEQLARWTPQAAIELAKDVDGNPLTLVINYHPMEGSETMPLAEVASLWINGDNWNYELIPGFKPTYRYLIKLTEPAPRNLLFSVAPRNKAGLSGMPVSLSYTRPEPPQVLSQERWVRLRGVTVDSQSSYKFLLEAKVMKIDENETEKKNNSGGWNGVECGLEQGLVTCKGVLRGNVSSFDVYCENNKQPCLRIELDQL